ncbi:MAG TPA: NAD(P)H-binding protein [Candidatus Binatus sp.]|uniref:SDR family oxidoreductase n=1 Tax=Candidatus Binatus sp. TaxID=2811406 RepID=UPI002F42C324
MPENDFDVVTGASGYTGRYITRALLARGRRVRTLTGHPARGVPFGDLIEAVPFDFDRPGDLKRSLEGARALFNTYWIRFPHGGQTFDTAVANTRIMLDAATAAGVRKFVHISVTNATESSPLPYFRGKAMVEAAVKESALSYAIIRPALIFGVEDILLNNIAWLLRRFPFFAIPGRGDYRVQPIFAADLAEIAVNAARDDQSATLDAVGPEIFTFDELVRMLASAVGSNSRIVRVDPRVAVAFARIVGWLVRDITLTRDETRGLMSNLLVTDSPPNAATRFSEWLRTNADKIGIAYASELARHFR